MENYEDFLREKGALNTDSYTLAPQIGYWSCFCCEHDLAELKTQEDVETIIGERMYSYPRVWCTLEEAIAELAWISEQSIESVRDVVANNLH